MSSSKIKKRAGPAKHGHKRTNMQYLWTSKTSTCVLKLKWASTSEQETISSSPTQKFGCLPRNLKTGAGLSAAPARQLHLDTTLHGNAQGKPRQTGWADVINGGGARKWSLLTRCSKEIPLSKAAQEAALLESFSSRAKRSHRHPPSLTRSEPSSSSCLLFFWEGRATTHWSFLPRWPALYVTRKGKWTRS